MNYEELLAAAPSHDSEAFLVYLRENNKVVFDNDQWLVIENFKYHTQEKPWYTAFHKNRVQLISAGHGNIIEHTPEWWEDVDILWYQWPDWVWLKKSAEDQSVKRFHIHIHK